MRRMLLVCAVVVVGTAALPTDATMGGWVVVTVEQVPDHLAVGTPTRIEFTLRQHGRTLLAGRNPSVRVRPADAGWLTRGARFEAEPVPARPGRYMAMVSSEEPGEVEITIDADFMGQRSMLLPMPVLAAGARAAAPTDVVRGRHLFVGKGCVTCHMMRDDPEVADRIVVAAGPELTTRRPPDYVAAKLGDVRLGRPGVTSDVQMPDLGLDAAERAALVAYVTRPVTSASGSR